jgi:hypothetical protein
VTSQFSTFVSHRSSAFLRVIRLMVLATQLNNISHAGSRVTCHSSLDFLSCFSRLYRPGISLFRSECVILLVDSLYAEAIATSQSQSYVTTDGQAASLSWNKAPIWGLRPDLDYCLTVAGLLIWGALSDERTGLSFAIATGPRQRSHFRVRVL